MIPLYIDTIDWKGSLHKLEFFQTVTAEDLSLITQVQAVPFLDNNTIVLYEHKDGYHGLPGGTVEKDESLDKALQRELKEEISAEILRQKIIGYEKDTNLDTGEVKYSVKYFTHITLLNQQVNDPDKKSIRRKIVALNEASRVLNWGKRGEILIDLAKEELENN